MILGGTVAAVSIMAVPFAPNIWLLIVVLCVYGVASAFLGTAPAAAVGDAAEVEVALQSRSSRCALISGRSSDRSWRVCSQTHCRTRPRSVPERF
jgi:Na+/melibiose symporter-like transporter